MARFGGLGLRWEMMARGIGAGLCVLGLAAGSGGAVSRGEQVAPPTQDEPIRTLHVYANLMQIPVLVLSLYHTQLAPIPGGRFSVSIDSGPPFRPTHVRPEGDDPISLSILLDARGPEDDLLPKMQDAIAGLAPLFLQPQDRISIYALDCSLAQSLNGGSVGPAELKRAVDLALRVWADRRKSWHSPRCQQALQLRDALSLVVEKTYSIPGRHVVLAVTDGSDKGSKHSWDDVRILAQAAGVAIFGLAYDSISTGVVPNRNFEDNFNSACELSGGTVLTTTGRGEAQALKKFLGMVRGRYIVEFPRPVESAPGRHDFRITIAKSAAFIRPAGISVPAADPAVLEDPMTVRPDASEEPAEGMGGVPTKPQ
jgi:hypothetical protein